MNSLWKKKQNKKFKTIKILIKHPNRIRKIQVVSNKQIKDLCVWLFNWILELNSWILNKTIEMTRYIGRIY